MFLFFKGTFQEFLFAGTMFLQKQAPFLPRPPKHNDSLACRPKTSRRCCTQQHNPQQRISVAALVGRSTYLLPSPPCQVLQLVHPPLVALLHPSWLVVVVLSMFGWLSCCPAPQTPSPFCRVSVQRCPLLLRRGTPLVWLVVMLTDGLPPPLSRHLCLSSFVGCCVALHCFALPGTLALLPLSSCLCFLSQPYNLVGCSVALTGALASLPLLLCLCPVLPPLVAPSRPPCLG